MPPEEQERPEMPTGLPAKVYAWTLAGLLIFALFLASQIFFPFIDAIILAIIIAALSYPIYQGMVRFCRGRTMIAALLFILLFILCLIIPVSFFTVSLSKEALHAVNSLQEWAAELNLQDGSSEFRTTLAEYLQEIDSMLPGVDLSQQNIKATIQDLTRELGAMSLSAGKSMLGSSLSVLISFCMMLLVLFFLLCDGPNYLIKLKYLLPVQEKQVNTIISNLAGAAKAILLGGVVVAILQGFIGGLGMVFSGLPALVWGCAIGFASFIPIIGTAIIWVPAVLYLVVTGEYGSAAFLFFWCAILVSNIDFVVRPYIMKGSVGVSPVLTLLSILGGVRAFGAIGLIYGPPVLMFAITIIRIARDEFQNIFGRGKSQATLDKGGPRTEDGK